MMSTFSCHLVNYDEFSAASLKTLWNSVTQGKRGMVTNYVVGMQSDFLSKKDHRHNPVLFGKVCLLFVLELFQYVICADKCETPFKANGNIVARCLSKNNAMKTCGRVDVYEQLLAF
jgi:hypothetical protein